MSLTLCIPTEATFGKYVWLWPWPARQRPSHNLLRVTQAVHRRGVDPVHAQLKRAMDCSYGIIVVLFAPGELPSRAPNGPRPVAHRCDIQIRSSKLFRFHNSFSTHDAFLIPTELI